ncbi:hypothetical protein AAGW05_07445 [Arthrobacter sp. LAPM80]|uniref:hypothetical protein n=1 Tax=Arthrobacter sp. LAPM80 TaxID=3141788 RepID=UPI00398B6D25
MAPAQQLAAPPLGGRGPATAFPSSKTVAPAKLNGTELSPLYASLALLGIAALAAAASSSLIPVLSGESAGVATVAGTGLGTWAPLVWSAGVASAAYSLAALVYGFLSFRRGTLPKAAAVRIVLAFAAAAHLAVLLEELWRMPETARTFDVTLASLLVLELSVIAVLGWRRNAELRRGPARLYAKKRSATVVVGTLFAASILVAGITTVGMAASTAGELAVPHSGHSGHAGHSGTENSPTVPTNLEQLKNQGHHH